MSDTSITTPRRFNFPAFFKMLFEKTPVDRAEIIQLLQRSRASGIIDSDMLEMIEGAIQVSE
ncbi:MAG: hypothetical protein F4Y53_05780, partial [Proteobacteria bacterium]|nr:hypothetical protein [Pseudomonadota bacterium]